MRKLLVLLLFLPLMATAKIPVEEDIIRQTLDSESPYYYPNLMLRYQSGDDSMTEEDYHYLYYGYAYQDAYKPLNANSDMDKAILIAQTVDFENPTHESLEKLIAAVNDALVQDPFSPKLLNLLAFAYGALGDSKNEQINYNRMNSILATIEDSGNGLKEGERLAYPDVRTCSICWPHTTVTTAKHASSAARWNTSPCSSRYGPKRGGSRDITSITAASTGTNPTTTYSNGPEPGNSTTCVRENTNNENRS